MIPTSSFMPWKKSVVRAFRFASLVSTTTSRLYYHSSHAFQPPLAVTRRYSTTTTATFSSISDRDRDVEYLNVALSYAKNALGKTFPNPAVGCVLVRQDTNQIIGGGFHPRAGFPHAEVFALLEATGHLEDGVKAAAAVVAGYQFQKKGAEESIASSLTDTLTKVEKLTQQYASENGPATLFSNDKIFQEIPVTAYVTLEPCCHFGKTPPCAASLVQCKVSRVVVGFRDPNPRVDGGGVQLLQDAGIDVTMINDITTISSSDDEPDKSALEVQEACSDLVADFVKRITPRPPDYPVDFSYITGSMRRALRSHAERLKSSNKLTEVVWKGDTIRNAKADDDGDDDMEAMVQSLSLDPAWMETLDHNLWENEIVLIRLNKAVKKKKHAKWLGERIADQLQAHVAQTLGHTSLLYRPGLPPVLDLTNLTKEKNNNDSIKE